MKKVFIFLFVGMLVIYQPIEVYADAGSLVVAGGSIGTGGLAVAGMAGLSGPAVVIVFTALMACGMNVELTRASQQAGMTKTEFVKNKIRQYCADANISMGTFCDYVLSQTKIAKNGVIELGSQAKTQIIQFGNWIFDNNDISTGTNQSSSVIINNKSYPYSNSFTITDSTYQYDLIFSSNVAIGRVGSNDETASSLVAFCKTANVTGQMLKKRIDGTGSITHSAYNLTSEINGYYNVNIPMLMIYGNFTYNPSIPWSGQQNQTSFMGSLDGTWNPGVLAPENDTFTGNASDWDNTKGNINTGVLNPGLNPGLDIPQDSDLTTSVQDYLDALKDVLDGVANPDITVRDEVTGIPADIPIDIPDVDDPALENPDPTIPDEDKTPVIDPSTPADPTVALEPLTIQLKGVFPFCIPFDYVDMLKLLKANATAPSYTVNWTIPIVNTNLNFTVDLSPYNDVAAILRKMELLAFCIALAIVTRSMFIRG